MINYQVEERMINYQVGKGKTRTKSLIIIEEGDEVFFGGAKAGLYAELIDHPDANLITITGKDGSEIEIVIPEAVWLQFVAAAASRKSIVF